MPLGSLRKDLILCLFIVLLCVYLFSDILFGGRLLTGADFVSFYLGLKQFLFNEVHQHHSIPFWNPFVFGGIPFLAHFESTIFYPLDILFWFIPPEKAYGITMFIHFTLASFFMYILARSLGMGFAGSFAASTVYILNGHILPVLNNGLMFRIQACTWIPLILFVLRKAVTSNSPYHYAGLAGVLWGFQILSGSPQDAFYTFLAGCFFLLCHVKPSRLEMGANRRLLFIACLVFITGAGLTSIQLVPAFEFINRSVRTLFDNFTLKAMGSYPLEGIITTVMPHFFGNFVERSFWVSGTPWSVPVYNLYVGILPLFLFIFMPFRRSTNRRILVFSLGLAVFSLLLAFGANTPFYKMVSYLPGFDSIRAPAKTIALWVLALALLTGLGMDNFFRTDRAMLLKRIRVVILVVCCILALGVFIFLDKSLVLKVFTPFILDEAIPQKMSSAVTIITGEYGRLMLLSALSLGFILLYLRRLMSRKLALLLFCCLLLGDLLYVNRGAVPHRDELYQWAEETKLELDSTIGKDKEIYRVGSYSFGMGASIEMYLGYQTVGGYNAMFLRRYYKYINQYRFYEKPIPLGWIIFFYGDYENAVLMDLLNLKYVISYADKRYGLRGSYLPRAFMVPQVKTLPKKEILDHLISSDFDPRKIILLEDDTPPPGLPGKRNQTGQSPGTAAIESYRPDEIVINTDSHEDGFLFLGDAHYPGWKAYLNDKPAKILRGNYLFRVIQVPRGRHVVRFVFDPVSIKVGAFITILTILIIVIAMSRRAFRSRKSQR